MTTSCGALFSARRVRSRCTGNGFSRSRRTGLSSFLFWTVNFLAQFTIVLWPPRHRSTSFGRTRNEVERCLGGHNTIVNCARKFTVQNKKLDNPVRRDLLKPFPVHLERTRRAENSAPHEVVIRRADSVDRREQQVILRVQYSRRLLRAFDQPAEAAEVPAFVVRHGRVNSSEKQVAGRHYIGKEILARLETARRGPGAILNRKVKAVETLPRFEGDVLPREARVLAGRGN